MIEEGNYPNNTDETYEEENQWTEPRSPQVPSPTYWPAVAAFSVSALLFGILTSWVISVVGFLMFAISIIHWIEELRDAA